VSQHPRYFVEYALVLALTAAICLLTLFFFGSQVTSLFSAPLVP